jgi:hypothetical protein
MHAPDDPDLRLALLLVWALHVEAERLADAREESEPDPQQLLRFLL